MKRTRLRTRTGLKARKNADGKPRERFEKLRDDAFRDWIRALPCAIAHVEGHRCYHPEHRSDAAHVESKARGAGDAGNLVPLCRRAHEDQHAHGIKSFQREYKINLKELAGALWLKFESEQGAPVL